MLVGCASVGVVFVFLSLVAERDQLVQIEVNLQVCVLWYLDSFRVLHITCVSSRCAASHSAEAVAGFDQPVWDGG